MSVEPWSFCLSDLTSIMPSPTLSPSAPLCGHIRDSRSRGDATAHVLVSLNASSTRRGAALPPPPQQKWIFIF